MNKRILALMIALAMPLTLSAVACASKENDAVLDEDFISESEGNEEIPPTETTDPAEQEGNETEEVEVTEKPSEVLPVEKQYDSYLTVTGENVNLRKGAGTSYSVVGTTEKGNNYALLGTYGDWYKIGYQNSVVYISKKYCSVWRIEKSDNEQVEKVISQGYGLLGTKYVYGAVRYHDGKGKLLSGFTVTKFDCSSLMQYIFYKGAGTLLDVNTRTQVLQGKTVSKNSLQRGDLIFFTNASRKNNTGLERIGHVAIYLGDNKILHTASDYARIEEMTAARWENYIQAQRMI